MRMKYYTKEWYHLMQQMDYTCGMKKVPDKVYTDAEIRAFYDHDLQKEIANDRRIYNMPHNYDGVFELLETEPFDPHNFLIVDEKTGAVHHPETREEALAYFKAEKAASDASFAARPPFDPAETVACFKECYRGKKRYAGNGYPAWFRETADMRLLALDRIPKSAYNRLKKEERANKRAFEKINSEADAVLSAQDIPEELQQSCRFHDANVLTLTKVETDVEMILRDGGFIGGDTPYCRVIFRNVSRLEREKGLVIRTKQEENGEYSSNIIYLYDELYRTDGGYEVHMLLTGRKELRYLTVACGEIHVENSISFPPKG